MKKPVWGKIRAGKKGKLDLRLLGKSLFFVLFCLLVLKGFSFFHLEKPVSAGNLTNASATLSNSRLSYKSSISTNQSVGDTTITIDTDSGDDDTDHLFPGDTVCFVNADQSGCEGDRDYTVGSITTTPDGTSFTITDGLDKALIDTDFVVATQSGTLTLQFVLSSEVPSTGDILVTLPSVDTDSKTDDSFPDTNSTLATNGFDIGVIDSTNISTTSTGCNNNWTTVNPTAGGASADTTIRLDRNTDACGIGTTVSMSIGITAPLINPAPITSGHTQGTADYYSLTIQTRDGSDNQIDTVNVMVAPVEGVFVSATVEETLSFTIAAVGVGSSHCGASAVTDVTTYAFAVPFGTLDITKGVEVFKEAEQQLTVTTNAASGYKVYTTEDDELGKDGADSPFIPDTPCDSGPCTHTTAQDWVTPATYHGLGYSLVNSSGTNATFQYSDGTWNAKQFPNESELAGQYDDASAEVMSYTGPVSGSSVYVCYRISADGTQAAGYYYNKIWYIATPIF